MEFVKSYDDFKTVGNDYPRLNKLMLEVIVGKRNSPIYGDTPDSLQEIEECAYWWLESDERYLMLKEINKLGLITINCEEGFSDHYQENPSFCSDKLQYIHSSLSFIIPIEKIDKFFEYAAKYDDLAFYRCTTSDQDLTSLGILERISTCFSLNKNTNVYQITSSRMYSKSLNKVVGTFFEDSDFEDCGITLMKENKIVEIYGYDKVLNRPPNKGLFKGVFEIAEALHS